MVFSSILQLASIMINLLVVCWLKHYACYTGQLADIHGLQNLLSILKMTRALQLFSFKALFGQLVIHRIFLLLGRKILDKKILANLFQFVKFAKIFSLQNFVSYGTVRILFFILCTLDSIVTTSDWPHTFINQVLWWAHSLGF